jgi:hypothetical protein
MHPPSVLDLYWYIRGEVACDEHARRFEYVRSALKTLKRHASDMR